MRDEALTSYRIAVAEKYAEVLTHFYVARNDSALPVSKTLVPTFQAILVFNFGEPAQVILEGSQEIHGGKCLVFGPVKKQLTYLVQPGSELLVVNFKDDAFYRFFGNALAGEQVPVHPDALLDTNCFEQLWHRLSLMKCVEERIRPLLDLCEPYLKNRNPIAAQLADFSDETQNEVKAVAADMQISERTVQKAYKKHFGFTSKEKQRYQRFLRLIRALHKAKEMVDWQNIAYRYGYYDQSHLIHDFNYYLGVSPEQYLKSREDMCLGNL
ncbi:AraC family transcriptional regulator [Olivibacter sp. XZL3]|uniref:AraC family transcriptional regulator n=1 Tax=Olivibacter sp. XZL3 TaxID=1735116 RepID=UPI00106539F3|nr:AraC family transcriptional regulator [Olivibacter sp. XZL3]